MVKRKNRLISLRHEIIDLNVTIYRVFYSTILNDKNLVDVGKVDYTHENQAPGIKNAPCTTYRKIYSTCKFKKFWDIIVEENSYEKLGEVYLIDHDVYIKIDDIYHYDFNNTKTIYRDTLFEDSILKNIYQCQWSLGYPNAKYALSKRL